MNEKYRKVMDFIFDFAKNVEKKIQDLEKFRALKPEEKKARLDEFAVMIVVKGIEKLPVNAVVKFVIKGFMVKYMSTITQAIYDLIKTKIDGITAQ